MATAALSPIDVPPGRAVQLGLFIAVSILLHAALIGGVRIAPFSGIAGGEAQTHPPLEVTIGSEVAPANSTEGQQVESERPAAAVQPAVDSAAGGTGPEPAQRRSSARNEGAIEVPAAIKWNSAEELDARAEPLLLTEFEYPEALRGTRVFGKVRLRLFIDEQGALRKLEIVASEPAGVFDAAAAAAWSSVRFTPARNDGARVKSQKLIELAYAPD